MKILTQRGVVAEFQVVALKPLFSSPSVVPSFHYDVDLLVAILTHVSTEDPASTGETPRISTVHGASPHVPDSVRVHLRSGARVADERVVRWDPVRPPTGLGTVHVQSENFPQQSTPGKEGSAEMVSLLWSVLWLHFSSLINSNFSFLNKYLVLACFLLYVI